MQSLSSISLRFPLFKFPLSSLYHRTTLIQRNFTYSLVPTISLGNSLFLKTSPIPRDPSIPQDPLFLWWNHQSISINFNKSFKLPLLWLPSPTTPTFPHFPSPPIHPLPTFQTLFPLPSQLLPPLITTPTFLRTSLISAPLAFPRFPYLPSPYFLSFPTTSPTFPILIPSHFPYFPSLSITSPLLTPPTSPFLVS